MFGKHINQTIYTGINDLDYAMGSLDVCFKGGTAPQVSFWTVYAFFS